MINIEEFKKCSTSVDKKDEKCLIFNLPGDLIDEALGYFTKNGIKIEEGSIFEKDEGTLSSDTKMTGIIFLKPIKKEDDKNSLQLIPIYKEEVSFARRMGWRKLVNMFKYLTPEEFMSGYPDRYNIITDVEGRRNCF